MYYHIFKNNKMSLYEYNGAVGCTIVGLTVSTKGTVT